MPRPIYPSLSQIPLKILQWPVLEYEIIAIDNVEFIVPKKDSTVREYEVAEYTTVENLIMKQPQIPTAWNNVPFIHLLRINPDDKKDILEFVNRWGLLGIAGVYEYTKNLPESYFFDHSYLNDDNGTTWDYGNREPLTVFIKAVKEFQFTHAMACESRPELKKKALQNINLALHTCTLACNINSDNSFQLWWDCNTLLHACYLSYSLNLGETSQYRICSHKKCNKTFRITKSNQKYCSDACQNAAKRMRNYYKKRR